MVPGRGLEGLAAPEALQQPRPPFGPLTPQLGAWGGGKGLNSQCLHSRLSVRKPPPPGSTSCGQRPSLAGMVAPTLQVFTLDPLGSSPHWEPTPLAP